MGTASPASSCVHGKFRQARKLTHSLAWLIVRLLLYASVPCTTAALTGCASPRLEVAAATPSPEAAIIRTLRAIETEQARQTAIMKDLEAAVFNARERQQRQNRAPAGADSAHARNVEIEARLAALESRADESARRELQMADTLARLDKAIAKLQQSVAPTAERALASEAPPATPNPAGAVASGSASLAQPGYNACRRACALEGAQSNATTCSQRCTCEMQCLAFGALDSCREFCRVAPRP